MQDAVRRAVEALAGEHSGVVARWDLARLGVDRDAVAREVAAHRWATYGRHTVAVHRGPLPPEALRWQAVWEVGHRVAVLDGVSSLLAAGLSGYTDPVTHVSVTRNSRCPVVPTVRVHRVRRMPGEQWQGGSWPRTRPDVAAIRAAGWAASDRQAALVLAMVVQQRLVTGAQLVAASHHVRIRGRRPFVRRIVRDIAAGAQSLGELDFAAMCRRHGLPEPDRQVVRTGPRGRLHLDVRWQGAGVVVEIDGAGHRQGLAVIDDNLRQNAITLGGDRVLRFDLLALRLHEREVMAQVRRALSGRV
jgi:very-short-patch-repair endonuclease